MTAPLCKCNNCDIVLIDQNPQVDAKQYTLKGSELEMTKDIEGYLACPICLTDAYLIDL